MRLRGKPRLTSNNNPKESVMKSNPSKSGATRKQTVTVKLEAIPPGYTIKNGKIVPKSTNVLTPMTRKSTKKK